MSSLARFPLKLAACYLAIILMLSSGNVPQAQQAQENFGPGAIQTFPEPTSQSDDIAIKKHKKVLRAEVSITPNTVVKFYEQPTGFGVYNSTVTVAQAGKVIATYPVAEMIRHQPLRLVHVALLKSGEKGMLVGEYEGGAVGAREGFVILRFSSSGVKLHTLPLTDYGKVVVSKNDLDHVEIWSALDDDVGVPVEDRLYAARACHWQSQGFLCGPSKRKPGSFSPGNISDPGIEVR